MLLLSQKLLSETYQMVKQFRSRSGPTYFQKLFRWPSSLDADQDRHFVGQDPNGLQRLSAADKSHRHNKYDLVYRVSYQICTVYHGSDTDSREFIFSTTFETR